MGVFQSDLRRVSQGCQVVSHDVITDAGHVVTASADVVTGDRDVVKVATGVVTGCQEVTTEFREPSIDEGVETKGNARNLIWLLFQ